MIKHKVIYKGGSGEIIEKKSRFIAHVSSVQTVEEAQQFIEDIKKKYWDARHNCYAFSVGEENVLTRCSDDGEPGGTAGKPILEVILGSEIHNVVIVVTRYFGGTLLGTGGLVRAYTDAAKEGLAHSTILEKIPGKKILLRMDYTDLGKVQYLLAQWETHVVNTEYTDSVEMVALFPEETGGRLKKELTEATSGRIIMEEKEEIYFGNANGETVLFDING